MALHLEDLLQLRVTDLKRAGGLESSSTFRLSWADGSQAVVESNEGLLKVSYSYKGEPRHKLIEISYSSCNYGGQRSWLVCPIPSCNKRAGVLFVYQGYFICRRCTGLLYSSQHATANWRATERMWKMRAKHGIKRGDLRPPYTIARPKGKHHLTHQRDIERLEHLEDKAWGAHWNIVQKLKACCRLMIASK